MSTTSPEKEKPKAVVLLKLEEEFYVLYNNLTFII